MVGTRIDDVGGGVGVDEEAIGLGGDTVIWGGWFGFGNVGEDVGGGVLGRVVDDDALEVMLAELVKGRCFDKGVSRSGQGVDWGWSHIV